VGVDRVARRQVGQDGFGVEVCREH
jgi:hypothetical protein